MTAPGLVFLKLGGSLITDKDRPSTARIEVLNRLAAEIASARAAQPDLPIVLGHGSGSFGHAAAHRHAIHQGVHAPAEWRGLQEVWREARALNQITLEAFDRAGLPVMAFPPSAAALARDGQVIRWEVEPLRLALQGGLIPLVNGDILLDETRGGVVLSTEGAFVYLAHRLRPARILLAGLEPGVWADFPTCSRLAPVITPQTLAGIAQGIGGSVSVDVTGGMREKVQMMLALVEKIPGFEAQIFTGLEPGLLARVLLGEKAGATLKQSG